MRSARLRLLVWASLGWCLLAGLGWQALEQRVGPLAALVGRVARAVPASGRSTPSLTDRRPVIAPPRQGELRPATSAEPLRPAAMGGEKARAGPARRTADEHAAGPRPSRRGGASIQQGRASTQGGRGPAPVSGALVEVPARGLLLSQATVRRLAASGRRPEATPVGASGRRPAGLRLAGVSGYGVGLREGDVLTHVLGQPVTSAGQVVGLVLRARAARVAVITGTVWRHQRAFKVAVVQPYGTGPAPGGADQKQGVAARRRP